MFHSKIRWRLPGQLHVFYLTFSLQITPQRRTCVKPLDPVAWLRGCSGLKGWKGWALHVKTMVFICLYEKPVFSEENQFFSIYPENRVLKIGPTNSRVLGSLGTVNDSNRCLVVLSAIPLVLIFLHQYLQMSFAFEVFQSQFPLNGAWLVKFSLASPWASRGTRKGRISTGPAPTSSVWNRWNMILNI